jgi:beta-galactosidase
MDWFIRQACESAAIGPVLSNTPAGVETVQRVNGKSGWLFLLNHSHEKVTIPFKENGLDLLTGAEVHGKVELEPKGVAIIQWK